MADIRAYAVRAITLINGRAKKLIRDVQDICNYKRDALSYKRLEFLQVGFQGNEENYMNDNNNMLYLYVAVV